MAHSFVRQIISESLLGPTRSRGRRATAGQPLSISTPAGTTTLTYNQGNLATITDPLGNITTREYDGVSRMIQQTDPLGRPTNFAYDPLNQLRQILDPAAQLTQFNYDPNGNLLTLTDARGNATSYVHNTMDRVTSRTDPLTRSESYAYDNDGNPTSFTDRKSQMTSSTYDALGRLTQVTYQDGSTRSYTYDTGNRLTQVADSLSGTITLSYDNLDRLIQETTPQGSVSYTYDGAGRRTSMTVAGQPTVSYDYDNADRLTSITQGSAVVSFTYDTANRRTSLTLPNGLVTEYAYDAASRLTGLTYKQGSTTIGALTYGYNAAGERVQTGGTWARTGQPTAMTGATYNAANHQLTFGSQTLTYDLNGNLTSDGVNTLSWNARNQLVGINGASVTASFSYDAFGRRTSKTINGATTSFVFDGDNPVQELTSGNTTNLLTGLGVDEYFTRADAAGSRTFLTDILGSTLALADQVGAVQAQYTYEAFGATTVTGTGTSNAAAYTGQHFDVPTGLYHYRARFYSPALHRFISEDPIGLTGGINPYLYVDGNPIMFIDPWGLLTTEELTNIIYNETRSLSGPRIFEARINIAHAVLNGVAAEEAGRIRQRPRTAPTTLPTGGVLAGERLIYLNSYAAALAVQEARISGLDPTGGAMHFNFRPSNSTRPFFGMRISTQVGPLDNSYPTPELPRTGIYANTYGGRPLGPAGAASLGGRK